MCLVIRWTIPIHFQRFKKNNFTIIVLISSKSFLIALKANVNQTIIDFNPPIDDIPIQI